MPDESRDLFVPIRDESGEVTGLMDRATADYLASQAPDPTQQSIDALLQRVTWVRVVPMETYRHRATKISTLLDKLLLGELRRWWRSLHRRGVTISDSASIASFRSCFAIVEDPKTFGHCMCFGDPHIELYAGYRLAATIGYHHGKSIRWDAWKHDAQLQEPERLLDWMSAHGVDGPRREVEEASQQREEFRRQSERWLESMPACFRPFWEQMDRQHDLDLHRLLLEVLRIEIPDPKRQVLTLFGWFGSGAGPWSGFPAYESVAEELLLDFSTEDLVDVAAAEALNEQQLEGAARFFAGSTFATRRPEDRDSVPPDTRRCLLEHALKSGDADKVLRARKAFATVYTTPPVSRAAMELIRASEAGDLQAVKSMLARGAPMDGKDARGKTAVFRAVSRGHQEVTQALLEKGAPVKDEAGADSLGEAALHGQIELVRLLLDHGADPNKKGWRGLTPMDAAIRSGHKEIKEMLLKASARS